MANSLSATVAVSMTVDLEPFVATVARAGKKAAGEAPTLTERELEQAREHVGRELDAANAAESSRLEERIASALPKGARLVEVKTHRSGLMLTSRTVFALDDLSLLPKLAWGTDTGAPAPFASFKVTSKNGSVTLEGSSPSLPTAEGAQGQLRFELETARQAISHNASEQRGNRLAWEVPLHAPPTVVKASFPS